MDLMSNPIFKDLLRDFKQLQGDFDALVKPEKSLGMSLISETVLSASAASVTFSSIPQNYRHLMFFVWARTDRSAEQDNILLQFNGDSGNNYDYSQLFASGASPSAGVGRAVSTPFIGTAEGANSRASNFAPTIALALNYTTSQEKNYIALSNNIGDLSADADVFSLFRTGHWRNTAAISSATILPLAGPNFVSGCKFQLYGIK